MSVTFGTHAKPDLVNWERVGSTLIVQMYERALQLRMLVEITFDANINLLGVTAMTVPYTGPDPMPSLDFPTEFDRTNARVVSMRSTISLNMITMLKRAYERLINDDETGEFLHTLQIFVNNAIRKSRVLK